MSPCELTATVTALANILASKLSNDEIAVLVPILAQLSGTLDTIHAQREICEKSCSKDRTST